MNAFPRCCHFVPTYAFAAAAVAGTLCFVSVSSAETYSDMGLTHYLHHKLGIHDYLYGPGGVVPRYTGIPEHVPTQKGASLLRGTYPSGYIRRNPPSRKIRFDDLNLLVTMPAGPWTRLDPAQTGSRARFLASRNDPTIVISLAGEAVGIESGVTTHNRVVESQTKMLSIPGATIVPNERLQSAGGIPGVAFSVTVGNGQSTAYYSFWVAAHRGCTYQLAVYGDQFHQRNIDGAMQNFLAGLKQIQFNRVASGNGKQNAVRQ